MWVSMIPHLLIKHHPCSTYNNTVNLRKKFNSAQSSIADSNNLCILDLGHIFHMIQDFDHMGNLTKDGKETFWSYIDSKLTKFDADRIGLKPKKEKPSQHNFNNNSRTFDFYKEFSQR